MQYFLALKANFKIWLLIFGGVDVALYNLKLALGVYGIQKQSAKFGEPNLSYSWDLGVHTDRQADRQTNRRAEEQKHVGSPAE